MFQYHTTKKSTPVPAAFSLALRLAGMGGDENVGGIYFERYTFFFKISAKPSLFLI